MKLSKFIHNKVIDEAEQSLAELRSSVSSKPKTEQQKKLDDWFSTRADAYSVGLAELVQIIAGYRPQTATTIARKNYEILNRGGTCWIVLKANMYGFSSTSSGHFSVCAADKAATVDEAETFIKHLKSLKSEDFARWCGNTLGPDYLLSL